MTSLESSSSFKELLNSPNTIVSMFSAEWCGPCKLITPQFNNLEKEGIVTVKVDVNKFEDLFNEYKIASLPTFIIFENGQEIQRESGSKSFDTIKQLFG